MVYRSKENKGNPWVSPQSVKQQELYIKRGKSPTLWDGFINMTESGDTNLTRTVQNAQNIPTTIQGTPEERTNRFDNANKALRSIDTDAVYKAPSPQDIYAMRNIMRIRTNNAEGDAKAAAMFTASSASDPQARVREDKNREYFRNRLTRAKGFLDKSDTKRLLPSELPKKYTNSVTDWVKSWQTHPGAIARADRYGSTYPSEYTKKLNYIEKEKPFHMFNVSSSQYPQIPQQEAARKSEYYPDDGRGTVGSSRGYVREINGDRGTRVFMRPLGKYDYLPYAEEVADYKDTHKSEELPKFNRYNTAQQIWKPYTDGVGVHEVTHLLNFQDGAQAKHLNELIDEVKTDNQFRPKSELDQLTGKPSTTTQYNKFKDYLLDPAETYSHLMQFRFRNNIQPGDSVTQEQLNKMPVTGIRRGLPDKTVLRFLNEIAEAKQPRINKYDTGTNIT